MTVYKKYLASCGVFSPREDYPQVFVITALSGAGKSTALQVFEDLRFFTADGLPPHLAPDLVDLLKKNKPFPFAGIALGINQYNSPLIIKDMAEKAIPELVDTLRTRENRTKWLHLEASTSEIMRRYATTRRPHPLEQEGLCLDSAIKKDKEAFQDAKPKADFVLDTTQCSLHDLRRIIQRQWGGIRDSQHSMKINLISFGFKHSMPPEADLVFDVRFLPNPYFIEHLKTLTGQHRAVESFIFTEEAPRAFLNQLFSFLDTTLPLYEKEGRYRLTIALGCTGGKHRSVATVEALADRLRAQDYALVVEHRHIHLQ